LIIVPTIVLMFELIPAIDLRAGKCVRLRQGDYARETIFGDDPAAMAIRWAQVGAHRLHLVDLDGAKAGRPVNVETIRRIVEAIDIPCQLGGGLRDEAALRLMLEETGVGRVIVGTQALKERDWFRSMAEKFPGRLVLGIDARNSLVATEGWLDVSKTSAFDLAREYAALPLAAIIYTNIANDGMMAGVDQGTLDDLARLADLGLPVIASGGVTTLADVENLVRVARAHSRLSGAIVGRAIYEGTLDLAAGVRLAEAG
jgi:phosphoribosylformimino-5-aminoimidazole carboxamide ribotide isomerase